MSRAVSGTIPHPILRDVLVNGAASLSSNFSDPRDAFDLIIEWILFAMLAFAPATFGVVHPWSRELFVALAAVIALCLAAKFIVNRHTQPVLTWALLPIILFVALALFALIPLPNKLLSLIAPQSVGFRANLLSDLPDSSQLIQKITLSFYPLATRHELWMVLSYAAIFAAVINVMRRRDQIRRLLLAITLIGALVTMLALVQDYIGTERIYFYWRSPSGAANAGPFANHSHFSQFMNLSIGAAIALLLVRLRETASLGKFMPSSLLERIHLPEFRILWLCCFVIFGGFLAVFLSMSRGGIVALLVALTFTGLSLGRQQKMRLQGWLMLMLALTVFAALCYIGFDTAYDRWIASRHVTAAQGRLAVVRDAARAARVSPVFGTGLGTNPFVFPIFDSAESTSIADYADDDYAQTAIETGLLGIAAVAAFIAIIAFNYSRCIRRGGSRTCAAAFGLGFGILAIMVHSFSDYGQHIPANALLTAIACGLLINLARLKPATASSPDVIDPAPKPAPIRRAVAIVASIALSLALAYGLFDLNHARVAQKYADEAQSLASQIEQDDWRGSNRAYTRLLAAEESAVAAEPENVTLRYNLNSYRWRSISRVSSPATGGVVMTPQTKDYARRIVAALHHDRVLCPTYGLPLCLAGQIEAFVLDDLATGARHAEMGQLLSPNHDIACYTAGLTSALQGKWDDSVQSFRKCVRLNPNLLNDVVDVYLKRVNRPQLAVDFAKANADWLLLVSNRLTEPQYAAERARARTAAMELLKQECDRPHPPPATAATLAMLCQEHQDYDNAVEYYRQALDGDYGQVTWRLALAQCLAKTGRNTEAVREATICLRLEPQTPAARSLIEELSVKPASTP